MGELADLLYACALFASLSAIGVALDKLILPDQAEFIKDRLTSWWVRISDLGIPDVPLYLVQFVINIKNQVFGERTISTRFFVVSILLSLFATFFAYVIGDTIFNYQALDRTFYSSLTISWHFLPARAPTFIVNYIFDFMTLVITITIFERFLLHKNMITRLTILAVDVVIAVFLAMLVFYITEPIIRYFVGLDDLRWGVNADYINTLHSIIAGDWSASTSRFIFSSTTLVPTVFWVFIVGLLIVSIFVYKICRIVILHVLRLSVDMEKSVFFYTGTLFGALAMIGKIIHDVVKRVA